MTTTAKDLFVQGDYRAAEKAFLTTAKTVQSPTDRSIQLSNASQCVLNLFLYERASQHAREAIILDPRNAKAHYRLATAYAAMPLPQKRNDAARRCCDIAMANARAFALITAAGTKKPLPTVVGLEVVSGHRHPVSARAAALLRQVSESQVVLVSDAQDIVRCCGSVAVLVPNCKVPVLDSSPPSHIVGLDGSAMIHAFIGCHALFLKRSALTIWSVSFEGASGAMICTTSDLALIDCSVSDHDEHALLVAERTGTALIAFCTLNNCTSGIEVREGASATVLRSTIRNMSQKGILAYGGVRSVVLEDTLMENVGIEGVQCLGPRAPAVLDPFGIDEVFSRCRMNSTASAVADAIAASARENENSAQLHVTLRNCCVRRCGTDRSQMLNSGVTIDQGANALIQGCLFTGCGMASVFIKGGCNVSMLRCRIDHGNTGDAGVRVDVNYTGKVSIEHSVFVGKRTSAIVDSVRDFQPTQRARMRVLTGATSSPIKTHMIERVLRARNAPSIESLRKELELAEKPLEQATKNDQVSLPNFKVLGGAGALYRQLGKQYTATEYPIGNTYGRDVLHFAETRNHEERKAFVVFAACGDIRNVVETICALEKRQFRKVNFLLNDISISILARNITLLELACRLWPKACEGSRGWKRAGRIWLHAWGSIALTSGDYSALHRVLTDLTEGNLPEWLLPPSADIRNALTSCWSEWASCKRTLMEVRNERDALATITIRDKDVAAKKAAMAAGLKETETCALLKNAELLNRGGEKVNPTLLASGLHYNMYESSIFRAIDMRTFIQGDVSNLHGAACDVMNTKGPTVARALHSGVLRIEVQPGDLTYVLASQRDVDAVDMSNALDYISKPACLISAARCLSRPGGILSLHTMVTQKAERKLQSLRDDMKWHYLLQDWKDLAHVLGLRSIELSSNTTDLYSHGVSPQSSWVYQTTSCGSSETDSYDKLRTSVLNAAKVWCRGPDLARQSGMFGFQIAAWPSAVAALQIVAASRRSTELPVANVVKEMCNASPAIAPFELELDAHAAIMDGKEKDLVLATFVLHDLQNQPVVGMDVHLLLQMGLNLGKDSEEIVWMFDVFECSASRGVCDVIVRKDDVSRISSLSARLGQVRMSSGVLKSETHSASGRMLKTRELSDSEITTLRKVLSS